MSEILNLKDFKDLKGQTVQSIDKIGDEELHFKLENGDVYKLYHSQDCCESVYISDINGDLDDLLNTPITMAEESSDSGGTDYGTHTWTFYKLATNKGYVDITWKGESNGYYSESVDFKRVS